MSVNSIRDEMNRQLDQVYAAGVARSSDKPPIIYNKPLEGRPMPATTSIKGLAGKLRDHLAKAAARAESIAGDVEKSVENLHVQMDVADKMKKEIDTAASEIQHVLGMDNGGPQ